MHSRFTCKDCVILNYQHRSSFPKVCKMGEIFDKNSFILGAKLNMLKNFLLRISLESYGCVFYHRNSKEILINKHYSVQIYFELYGWERCDHITEMR